jgi:hypothetical protein
MSCLYLPLSAILVLLNVVGLLIALGLLVEWRNEYYMILVL